MSIVTEHELESGTYKITKKDRKPSGDDRLSEYLLKVYYSFQGQKMQSVKYFCIGGPILVIFLFYVFVSSTTSNMIAFSALVISICFIFVALWILCWILDKDTGTRAMQDVGDPIKEGSEGFFIT